MSARFWRLASCLLIFAVCAFIFQNISRAQNSSYQLKLIPGPNVNMVSGAQWPNGDPYLQRQNEPSLAVSTRNPMHILAGANDYRTVDIPGLPEGTETGDSWLGAFWSHNAGDSWQSSLLPGYPQDTSSFGAASPLKGFRAAADPVVRAGTNGLFYYSGIAFDRGTSPKSTVFVARFMDLNNEEGGSPIKYIDTKSVKQELTGAYFIDKPWIAVDIPRIGAATATIPVPTGNNTSISQTVPCGNVYIAWTEIVGTGTALQSRIMFSRSTDCGENWSPPLQLSALNTLNQGATIAVAPNTGDVYVAWRQFPSTGGCIPAPFQKFVARSGQGYWKNHPEKWPAQSLTLGGTTYTKSELIAILNTPVKGDATYILAYQLIAAKLNYALDPNAAIPPNMNDSDLWLQSHPVGSKVSSKDAKPALDYAANLEQYNNGSPLDSCNPTDPANKIMAVRSDSAGFTFGTPLQVSNVNAFDQGTTNVSFRSTAYPTMTVDHTGRVYVAWSTRGQATSSANPNPATGDSRIVVATSPGGSAWPGWSAAQPIDQPKVPGHQIKPSLCFSGKLFLIYYDFREDVSKVFGQYIADLTTPRHTVDVRAALADPGAVPLFTDYSVLNWKPSDQISRYPFLIIGPDASHASSTQLQYNPPNLPLFVGGTAPFFGDYVDLAPSPQFVFTNGSWVFNTDPSGGSSLQVAWTDNRDVNPPPDGDWTRYVPPQLPGAPKVPRPSTYDSSLTVPPCQSALDAQRTGMRNQNVYNARVSRGLYVAAPGNSKPLGGIQRAFVIFVQNTTSTERRFRLQLPAPNGTTASFAQFGAAQTVLDVQIASFSSVSVTVYVSAPSQAGSIPVSVFEIDTAGNPVSGGLQSSVMLNPDPTNPSPTTDLMTQEIHNPAIYNPAIFNPAIYNPAIYNPAIFNPAILNPAIYNPAIYNPAIFNPAIFNPAIFNPAIFNPAIYNPAILNPAIFNPAIYNPAIYNPAILNPAIYNPAIFNPAIYNPAIMNPAILNPAIFNPAIMNTSLLSGTLTQATWVAQNTGNTTSAYSFNALLTNPPTGLIYQLLIYRLYTTPVADGCTLKEEGQQELLYKTLNPSLSGSLFSSDATKPTFFLAPWDYALISLLVYPDPNTAGTPADRLARLQSFNTGQISVGVVAEAVNSNAPSGGPPFASAATMPSSSVQPLVILAGPGNTPGGGTVGSLYGFTLTVTGGTGSGTYGWSLASGALPPGLILGIDGKISGTPTTSGNYTFTVRANDLVQMATQTFTIAVASGPAGSLVFVTQPSTATAGQNMPLVQVLAKDGTGSPLQGVSITMSIGTAACAGCSLSGGTSAITGPDGIAKFTALRMDRGGWGYKLIASGGSPVITALSNAFDVVGFCTTGSMNTARNLHTAALLLNGKVLVAAGWSGSIPLSSAELYDPAAGTWSTTGAMATARYFHTETLLPNGMVLVVGGLNDGSFLLSAELYDPATGTWSTTGSMAAARSDHTATLLSNGKVLVAGGINGSSTLSSAELYDPAAGTWSTTGSMTTARNYPSATLLTGGKVLLAGGIDASGSTLSSAELYDPTTGIWLATGSMAAARVNHTATLLFNGKVLVAGGWDIVGLSSAELYDPSAATWTSAGSMSAARITPTATLLPSGKVLVAGGHFGSNSLSSAELYDALSGTWSSPGAMQGVRTTHTATLLPNGKVLVTAGSEYGGARLASSELFNPDNTRLIFINQPGNGTAGIGFDQFQVRALDSHGAGIPLKMINIALVPGSCRYGSLSTNSAKITDLNGYVTFLSGEQIPFQGDWNSSLLAYASELGVMTTSEPFNVAGFCETGILHLTRYRTSLTLLNSGKVLMAAGEDGTMVRSEAQLYDPASGTWTSTGSLGTARYSHAAVLLPGGKVLVEGGHGTAVAGTHASAELYDPASSTWSDTGPMNARRNMHTATLLNNGKVLVTGGRGNPLDGIHASTELYDPGPDTWSFTTGSLSVARYGHTATLLQDGRVLVAGGVGNSGALLTAEIYNPVAGTWSSTGSFTQARSLHTATLLSDGRVLIAGGENGSSLSSAEIYNPATFTWSYTAGPLNNSRTAHTATLFPDDTVLIAGGSSGGVALSSAELYSPVTNTFSVTGPMMMPRFLHSAVLLPNGKILHAGGAPTTTELYYPACARYPSGYVPFTGVYSIAGPNVAGDRLLVGSMTSGTLTTLQSGIALPGFTNQCYCGLVELAPGRFATAYVPTAAERAGYFSAFAGLFIDPLSGLPLPGGVIPVSRMPGLFAWRIRSITP